MRGSTYVFDVATDASPRLSIQRNGNYTRITQLEQLIKSHWERRSLVGSLSHRYRSTGGLWDFASLSSNHVVVPANFEA